MIKKFIENLFFAPDTGVTPTNYDPLENEFINDVEKFAKRTIELARSTNPLNDAFTEIDIENGTDIEKMILKMAKSYDFDPTAALGWAQKDPEALTLIFSQWNAKQFEATYREEEWRKIALNAESAEEVGALVADTMTEGEGYEDFLNLQIPFVMPQSFTDYRTIAGRAPIDMDGVLYMARDMYHHITATNNDSNKGFEFDNTCPESEARIVMSSKLLDLNDVTKMANIFNMSKADFIGKLIVFNADNLPEAQRYFVTVLDRRAIVRGKRLFRITKDVSGRGLFVNFFLTVSRLYGICHLFKGIQLDCYAAAKAMLDKIAPAVNASNLVDVSVTSDNGIAQLLGTGKYYKGDTAVLSATVKKGKKFKGFYQSDGTSLVSANNPYTFEVTAGLDLKAITENAEAQAAQAAKKSKKITM